MQQILGSALGGGVAGAIIGLLMGGFSKIVFLLFLLGLILGGLGGIKRYERIADQKKAIIDAHEEIMKKKG